MSETPDNSGNNVSEAINAVSGLVEKVPVYQDAVQPAAKELGKGFKTVARAVNVALAPLEVMIWGYDQIKEFIQKDVAENLKDEPADNIVTPKPYIAVPAIEALRYTGEVKELRELYAKLLAASMKKDTCDDLHPGFVEILKQLSPEDAGILESFKSKTVYPLITLRVYNGKGFNEHLKNFSHLSRKNDRHEKPEKIAASLDNLCRLGLLEVIQGSYLTQEGIYDNLESDVLVQTTIEKFKHAEKIEKSRGMVEVTQLGLQLLKVIY